VTQRGWSFSLAGGHFESQLAVRSGELGGRARTVAAGLRPCGPGLEDKFGSSPVMNLGCIAINSLWVISLAWRSGKMLDGFCLLKREPSSGLSLVGSCITRTLWC